MSNRFIKIRAAAESLPDHKSKGGTRFYDSSKLLALGDVDSRSVCYARVGSHDQKHDLERQHAMLEADCSAKGWRSEVIKDLGSGNELSQKRTPTSS